MSFETDYFGWKIRNGRDHEMSESHLLAVMEITCQHIDGEDVA